MTSPEVRAFLEFLSKERNDSPHTVKAYGRDLADFVAFCGRYYRDAWSWASVDRQAIRAWLGAQQQRGLAKRSAARALSALRTFYRFLNATRGVEVNPAKAARTPKLERRLPLHLERVEIDLLFHDAERRAAVGGFREARDLAMLELFYSTGIRLSELAGLNEQDVDLVSDQLKVRGKGKKERIVPVGKHAGRALRRYYRLRDAVLAATGQERRAVFVSGRGKRLTPRSVQLAIKRLLAGLAGLAGRRSGGAGEAGGAGAGGRADDLHVHSLRHTCATHPLDAGADLLAVL